MKQTTQYKLNLFEGSDPFRAGTVNENTQKLEAALQGVKESLETLIGTKAKFQTGSYTGTGSGGMTLTFETIPKILFIVLGEASGSAQYGPWVIIPTLKNGSNEGNSTIFHRASSVSVSSCYFRVTDNTITLYGASQTTGVGIYIAANMSSKTYYYTAIY